MLEAVIVGQARAAYDALSDADLVQINAIISRLEADPWEDEETIVTIVLADEILGIYDDGRWEVAWRDGRRRSSRAGTCPST